ncbi:MAG: nuclear transport factor 2 family protein [Pseudomonadota bacterium]
MRYLPTVLVAAVLMINAPAKAAEPADHIGILRAASAIAIGADRHDWPRVRGAMADQITTDYSSIFGGKPVTQSADALVKGWAQFLPGFDSTHHMVSSLIVSASKDNTATAHANFTATHRIAKALWVLGGRYTYQLSKVGGTWRVTSMTVTALWETGDRDLIKQAAQRAATKQ